MKASIIITALAVLACMAAAQLAAQDDREKADSGMLLSEISASIEKFKSRDLTLRLRLKQVDRIFEKIVFYDRKNHDVEFDISGKERKKRLERDMRDIHEGMYYFVTFRVLNAGATGDISAELIGFRPAVLENLPEQGERQP